jgi:hypothetical protein
MTISNFCDSCGALLFGKKITRGSKVFCIRCGEQSTEKEENEESKPIIDQDFIQNKLKPILRQGREIKPVKSLARQLSLTEDELHEGFKELDSANDLPYGYYDKIEKVYVRTHQDEDIDEDLLLEMIIKSYGFKTFHHQGLTGFIRMGRHIPSRKVLTALHQLRKKEKLIGFKKGPRWLWRLPNPVGLSDDSDLSLRNEVSVRQADQGSESSSPMGSGFSFSSADLNFAESSTEEESPSSKAKERKEAKKEAEEVENFSLAELTRSVSPTTGESGDDLDDDDDFEIIFADAEEDE